MYLTPSCDCNFGERNVWCAIHGVEALKDKRDKTAHDAALEALGIDRIEHAQSVQKLVAHNQHLMDMAEQDRLWKERRMVSGHGAQDGAARDPNYKSLIVFLGGPIKHWWDENWMSPEHLRYDEWRSKVEETCIAAGFLVYKPFTAWKGTWNEQAQAVNNEVIRIVDVFIDLTPPGVPSIGTEEEREHASLIGRPIYDCPPPKHPSEDAQRLEDLVRVLTYDADMKNARLRTISDK
jgi:hypothetical protein